MEPDPGPALEAAEKLAGSERFASLVARLPADEKLRRLAHEDPARLLRENGLELPPELAVRFTSRTELKVARPAPEWLPFTVRLTNCRTVWVREEPDEPPREQTVCFGFELVPNPLPGGPIA